MASVHSKGNRTTELRLIAVFRKVGITGWRRNYPLFGRPDFVFPGFRVAIFVDGCFWHGCPLHATNPRNNTGYWRKKLAANKVRDRLVTLRLRADRWRVLRIWEHELTRENETRLLLRIRRGLQRL